MKFRFERLVMRWRWCKAWRKVVQSGCGGLSMRREYAIRFNERRFWWQKEIQIPSA